MVWEDGRRVVKPMQKVRRHRAEGRDLAEGEQPENLVLRFDPAGGVPML